MKSREHRLDRRVRDVARHRRSRRAVEREPPLPEGPASSPSALITACRASPLARAVPGAFAFDGASVVSMGARPSRRSWPTHVLARNRPRGLPNAAPPMRSPPDIGTSPSSRVPCDAEHFVESRQTVRRLGQTIPQHGAQGMRPPRSRGLRREAGSAARSPRRSPEAPGGPIAPRKPECPQASQPTGRHSRVTSPAPTPRAVRYSRRRRKTARLHRGAEPPHQPLRQDRVQGSR